MELSKYLDRYVKVDLVNGFYYEGVVSSTDENSIEIKDKFGKLITVSSDSISFIREVAR